VIATHSPTFFHAEAKVLADPTQVETRIKLYAATASYEILYGSTGTRSQAAVASSVASGAAAAAAAASSGRGDAKLDAAKYAAAVS
jgi:hypothetical protein